MINASGWDEEAIERFFLLEKGFCFPEDKIVVFEYTDVTLPGLREIVDVGPAAQFEGKLPSSSQITQSNNCRIIKIHAQS